MEFVTDSDVTSVASPPVTLRREKKSLDSPAPRGAERRRMPTETLERSLDKAEVWKLRFQQGLTYQQIATLTGYCPQRIHQVCHELKELIPHPESLPAYQAARGPALEHAERTLVASLLDPATIEKASLRDRAVSFGIVYDKRRLEQGQSTSNLAVWAKCVESAHQGLYEQAKQSTEKPKRLEPPVEATDK